MEQSKGLLLSLIILLFFTACDISSEDETTDPAPLEFTTEPSDDLRVMVEDNPSDFTWEFFSDNLFVSLAPGPEWSGEIVLSSLHIQGEEVTNRTTTEPIITNAEKLASGLSTEEMFPGLVYDEQAWAPGKLWVQEEKWPPFEDKFNSEHLSPVDQWVPERELEPSEIENVAVNEFDLDSSEILVVVYAHIGRNSSDREIFSQPYGLILRSE